MYGKISITGNIEVVTGMHVGGSDAFAAIGAVDSPVIRDSSTGLPMLPGSSLKGKLRALLARKYNETIAQNHDDDAPVIKRLFGSAKKNEVQVSRLLVADMFITSDSQEEIHRHGLTGFTEVKFENTINRLTAVANPRQIERVIRGVVFGLDMIYEITQQTGQNEPEEDFSLLAEGMRLLQYDYLGGHGSRGYGKVRFQNMGVSAVVGDIDDAFVSRLERIMQDTIGGSEGK